MFEEPLTLNPVLSTTTFENDVYQLIFDGLTRIDDRGHLVPDLARVIPTQRNGGISRDGKTITYRLVSNVRWQDGKPLTSADVIYTWQQIMNPANNVVQRTGYDKIASISAPDADTVIIHLRAPYEPVRWLFVSGSLGSIIPKHIFARYASLNKVALPSAIGSGPYVLKSWNRGAEMRFEANPQYFGGLPKIPHVVVRFLTDQNTLILGLRTHEVDVIYSISPLQAQTVRTIPDTTLRSVASDYYTHLAFNTSRAPLNDKYVRLALCYALDEDTIFHKIYHGLGEASPTHLPPTSLGADPSIRYYPYDPTKAAALLKADGWKLAANGVRYKAGRPLSFSISTVSGVKDREEDEVLLQSYWKAIGASVSVKNFAAQTFFAPASQNGPLYSGGTDVSLFNSDAGPGTNDEPVIAPWNITPAGQNISRFQNAEIGRLEVAGVQTYDPSQRAKIYRRINRILIDEVPEYVLDWVPQIAVSNTDIQNVRPTPAGSDLWNIHDWTISSSS